VNADAGVFDPFVIEELLQFLDWHEGLPFHSAASPFAKLTRRQLRRARHGGNLTSTSSRANRKLTSRFPNSAIVWAELVRYITPVLRLTRQEQTRSGCGVVAPPGGLGGSRLAEGAHSCRTSALGRG